MDFSKFVIAGARSEKQITNEALIALRV